MEDESVLDEIMCSVLAGALETDMVHAADARADLSASVHVRGEWSKIIVVSGSAAFADGLAGWFLGLPAAAVTEADRLEAFAELANIVAGNLKGGFPGPTQLSAPVVARGGEMTVPTATAAVRRCYMRHGAEDEQLALALYADIAATDPG
jgi:hypothetical protein